MNPTTTQLPTAVASATAPAGSSAAKAQRLRGLAPGGVDLGKNASREARQQAAVILEVLAGTRTPTEAAAALGIALPCYYNAESRALRGLLAACEPRPKGRVRTAASEVTALRQQQARLERELARLQALLRASQRVVGVAAPAAPPAKAGKKQRRRRPTSRALCVAARLQDSHSPAPPAPAVTDNV
jgi:hypothetical protein